MLLSEFILQLSRRGFCPRERGSVHAIFGFF
jgi:hypothetical protein